MRANLVAASQYSFIVNTTDHGTWRRLRHYTSKARFRRDPDTSNPYEKADDQRFVREYPSDPQFQSSILSILSHYYERLQNEHRGELKSVRAPTIDGETDRFRIEQDALHRWISQHVVASTTESGAVDYPLGNLGAMYAEWYSKHVERRHQSAGGVIKEIESSALGKHLKPGLNGSLVLRGCRVLTPEEALQPLHAGEEFLVVAEARGGRSAAELAAAAEAAAGRPWWEGRAARGPRASAPAPAPVLPGDAALAVRPTARGGAVRLTDLDIDDLLSSTGDDAAAP
jgi:hypothetical protein